MKSGPLVKIGELVVGKTNPPLFVAEIGTFFNQDMDKAERLMDLSIKGGADVFKTEILHTPDICLKDTGLIHKYNHAKGVQKENYRALVERKVVPLTSYSKLFDLCRQRRMPFVASVYDLEGIDFLVAEGGAGIKIARDNINNIPLLRHAGETGLPVIMDVAGHYLDEIARAVKIVRASGNGGVILNHHPAMNPATFEAHNLRVINTYASIFNLPTGLACHFRGEQMIYLAVAMGASFIEKGIFDNPDAVEQDVVSALEISRLAGVVKKMKDCWTALGDGQITGSEERDESTWKGLVAKKDIKKGDPLDKYSLGFAWPPIGISVAHWDLVCGKKAAADIDKNTAIDWSMVSL